MEILTAPMGRLETNCYVIQEGTRGLVIDPGVGATEWVASLDIEPVAILNTHGHYDHIWENAAMKEQFGAPLYIRQEDAFLLHSDPFNTGLVFSHADVEVADEKPIEIGPFRFSFWHMPGHTPGSAIIRMEKALFSGDFIFDRSIGRVDFPHSDPKAMKASIHRFLEEQTEEMPLFPGHGPATTVEQARSFLPRWLGALG